MSEIQSENIKPESSVVNPTQLSKARTSKNNKPAQAALSKARTSKNNKPAQATQATHSSDGLKTEVRFRKAKKISKSIKRIESEMSYIQSQMTKIARDLSGIVRLMQDKGRNNRDNK
jgi:MarR-like DNA-binding transcriptional regulator SgrR of sgrS sRNA